jgi:hypothetical protein
MNYVQLTPLSEIYKAHTHACSQWDDLYPIFPKGFSKIIGNKKYVFDFTIDYYLITLSEKNCEVQLKTPVGTRAVTLHGRYFITQIGYNQFISLANQDRERLYQLVDKTVVLEDIFKKYGLKKSMD